MAAFNALTSKQENKQQIEYSQFIQQVNNGEVSNVKIEGSAIIGYLIKGERTDKTTFFTNAPLDDSLVKTLLDNKVRVNVIPEEKPSILTSLFFSLLPVMLLIGAWFYFMRMQSGGGGKGGAFSFGKSRARLIPEDKIKVFFAFPEGSCRKIHCKLSDGNDKEVHEKSQPDEQAYLAVAPNFGDNVVDDVRNGKN